MSEKLGAKKQRKLMLATLASESNEQWALVELYRWQHGELPQMGSQKPLSVKIAVEKMAQSFADEDPKNWPAPMNIASVLAYLSTKLAKSEPTTETKPEPIPLHDYSKH